MTAPTRAELVSYVAGFLAALGTETGIALVDTAPGIATQLTQAQEAAAGYDNPTPHYSAAEFFVLRRMRAAVAATKLGFADVIEVDNIQVTWDYACPPNVGYGFNVENMELLLREDSLLKMEQDYDIDTQAQKYVMYVLGNLKFSSPRRFFKLADVA